MLTNSRANNRKIKYISFAFHFKIRETARIITKYNSSIHQIHKDYISVVSSHAEYDDED